MSTGLSISPVGGYESAACGLWSASTYAWRTVSTAYIYVWRLRVRCVSSSTLVLSVFCTFVDYFGDMFLFFLLQWVSFFSCLHITVFICRDFFLTEDDVGLKQWIAQFPRFSVLQLSLVTRGHIYGATVFNLLEVCTDVKRLRLNIYKLKVILHTFFP